MKLDPEEAHDTFIMYTFIQGTHQSRIGKLEEGLGNQFDKGVNIYPWNLENTTNMIINYEDYVNNPKHPEKKGNNKKEIQRNNNITK